MGQLKAATCCLGFALAVLLFVPRELGGYIGVVILCVTGVALAMTAPTPKGCDHDSSILETRVGSPDTVGREKSRVSDSTLCDRGDSEDHDVEDRSAFSSEPTD